MGSGASCQKTSERQKETPAGRDVLRILRVGVTSMQMNTQMKANRIACGLEVFLWLALALLVVVTQPVVGFVFLFLIPAWYFFAEVVSAPLPRVRETRRTLPYPELLVFSSRPPPLR